MAYVDPIHQQGLGLLPTAPQAASSAPRKPEEHIGAERRPTGWGSTLQEEHKLPPYVPNAAARLNTRSVRMSPTPPPYHHLTTQQQYDRRIELRFIWQQLHDTNPKVIPSPEGQIDPHSTDLYQLHYRVYEYIRTVRVTRRTSQIRMYLILFWAVLEFVGVVGLKINIRGYTLRNLKTLRVYEEALTVIGEQALLEDDVGLGNPYWAILWTSVIQLALTFGINLLETKVNPGMAKIVDGFLSRLFFSDDVEHSEEMIVSMLGGLLPDPSKKAKGASGTEEKKS